MLFRSLFHRIHIAHFETHFAHCLLYFVCYTYNNNNNSNSNNNNSNNNYDNRFIVLNPKEFRGLLKYPNKISCLQHIHLATLQHLTRFTYRTFFLHVPPFSMDKTDSEMNQRIEINK